MLTYFLQVNVCWLLFYGVYYALLSKETFFKLNRIWLIASLLCGLALPFAADYFAVKIEPTHLFALTLEPFVVTATALKQNLVADTEGVVLRIIAVIYGLGCTILTARFLGGLFVIFKLMKKSKIERQDGFKLVYTVEERNPETIGKGGIPPFSFFNFIFINPQAFENFDFQQIMQHEKAHVQQKHSYDVVFLEILNIVFWCSPLVYLYKKSLRNVHEYLADEAVLLKNAKAEYGRLLLRQRQSGMALSLTSNISNHFFSQLKKRILMMTRNKSKRTALIKYALAAPIFFILTAALASPETPILAKTEALSDKVVKTINDEIVDNRKDKSLITNNLSQKETPQYSTVTDTTFKPVSDLKLVDINQIQRMDVDKKDETHSQITITFKDGHIESFKGTKAEMEQAFKKETTDKPAPDQKLQEMVVVGFGRQKQTPEQKAQKLEDEKKDLKQERDKTQAENTTNDPVLSVVDEQPEFPQGLPALYKFLGQNIKYPKSARDAGGQGTVFVGFVVEKDGSITDVKVKKDAPYVVRDTITLIESNGVKGNKIVERTEYSLGKEAIRVISMMPNWKPGKKDGKIVRVSYTLPIKFKLD